MAIISKLVLFFISISVVTATSGGVTRKRLCRIVQNCVSRLDRGKKCAILPIPRPALVPTTTPGSFTLETLRPGVHIYNDGIYRVLLLRSGTRLVIVDIPDSPSSNKATGSMTLIADAANEVLNGTFPKRIDIIYSHAHLDHIGGTVRFVNYFDKTYPSTQIEIWGTQESADVVRGSTTNRGLPPTVIIGERNHHLKLRKGLELNFQIVGGHTGQDLLIFIPRYKSEVSILMYVDTILPKWAPAVNFGLSENLLTYMNVQRYILRLDFDVFVAGHFGIGTKEDIFNNLKYTEDVIEAAGIAEQVVTQEVLAAKGIGKIDDPNAREFGNILYSILQLTRPAQIDVCYRIILEKWGCKLAAVDVVLRSHCFTALFFRLLEF